MKYLVLSVFVAVFLAAIVARPSGYFSGSPQWVGATNLATLTVPYSVYARVMPKTLVAGSWYAYSLGAPSGGANYSTVGWTSFFGSVRWYVDVGGDYTAPTVVMGPDTNRFSSVTLVVSSATVRNAYLDGTNFWAGSGASISPSQTTWSIASLLFFVGYPNPYSYGPSTIADFAVWNVALDAGERAALDAGVVPIKVRPQSLVVYVPCYSTNFQAVIGPPNTSTNIGTLSDHPRIYR